MTGFLDLPDELIAGVLQKIEVNDIGHVNLVSRRLHGILSDKHYWQLRLSAQGLPSDLFLHPSWELLTPLHLKKIYFMMKQFPQLNFKSASISHLILTTQDLQLIRSYFVEKKNPFTQDCAYLAVGIGDLNGIQCLFQENLLKLDNRLLEHAVRINQWSVISFLCEQIKEPLPDTLVNHAARAGNEDVAISLMQHYKLLPQDGTMHFAIQKGCLNLVKYLIEKFQFKVGKDYLALAQENNHPHLTDYFSSLTDSVQVQPVRFYR
jgi:hypothetical protein